MTVGQRALRGTIWLSAANYAAYAIVFATDILLARLLFPEDFGQVALAVSVLEIVGGLSSLGVPVMIVQHQAEDQAREQRFVATCFSLQLFVAGMTLLLVLLLSAILWDFYGPTVITLLVALTIGRCVQIVNQIPSALVQKRMLFWQEALISLLSIAISSAVGVFLAWSGFGPWSLATKRLSYNVVSSFGTWWAARWRPKLRWDRETVCDAWRFGRNMWISSNSEGVLKDLDDTAVGTLGDTEALGYYSRAYKLSRLFIEFIAPAIVRTSFPMYSNLKDDPRALASVFGIVQRFLARMAALFYLEIGLLAPAVIALLYGEQWLPMVQLFRLMTVYAFLQPLFDQHVQVLLASNRPHILARIRLAQMAFFVPGVFIAAYIWGALGVAIVVDVMALLGMCLVIVQTRKLVAVSLTPIFVPSAVGAFVSLVAFWGVQLLWQTESYLVALLAFVPLIAIVFVGCLFVSEGKTLVGDIQRIRRGLLGASGV